MYYSLAVKAHEFWGVSLMKRHVRKLLTIVTEAAVESIRIKEVDGLGAQNYTITPACSKGRR